MAVEVTSFEWEKVLGEQGAWHHTEYTIQLTMGLTPACGSGATWTVRRRYSDFEACRNKLQILGAQGLPDLPPKEPLLQRAMGSFAARLAWQEQRLQALKVYVDAFLHRPDLLDLLPVQELLSLRSTSLLAAPPQAPASIRIKPLPLDEAAGEHPDTVEVRVQQATAQALEEERNAEEGPVLRVPVAEFVVLCRCAEEEGEVCELHLPVESIDAEARASVSLVPGRPYIFEVHSVGVTGLKSSAVVVSAQLPASPGESSGDDSAPADTGGDAADSTAVQKRREALSMRMRRPSFRGKAAAEYIAVASEKARQSYAKAPYQVEAGRRLSDGANHMLVEVEQDETRGEPDHTLHRAVALLDSERRAEQRQLRFTQACAVAAWLVEMTGREELKGDMQEDLALLREALASGEALCELVNRPGAAEGQAEGQAVPFYHKGPSTKFRCLENISLFLGACRSCFGVPEHQLFCATDIAAGRDMQAVVKCLLALSARMSAMYPELPECLV